MLCFSITLYIGVISVETVLYGLTDSGMCSEGKPLQEVSESCSPSRAVDNLKTKCNGKRVCEVTESVFGASQSCSGAFKYLQTNYTCLPANVGQIIHVYGADYGRRDQTTCSYKQPPSQIQNTDCSNPTNIVSDSCNGENSCTVKASNSVFGESCAGTLKYLEVAYMCEYIGVISVQGALYGRADNVTCSEGRIAEQIQNTRCSLEGTKDIVKERCDGKKMCELNIQHVRTADPCFHTYKYLETNYTCFPANVGQVIFVLGAYYGRSDQTTCSYKRDANQLENVYCSQSTRVVVANSCNGKNSCTIRVGSPLFEDPCVGTHKYLELSYVCEFPGINPV
ncbi:L-rhamnose-binding lectin SML [Collichthys lucidus]|uniref:L-rhamnose-binding lectin SML n=1 Tax=Collichthys lucidus TaxID=240159 RepID=A0A4U5UQE0_COLLU|nr:L-rhamnose-binding lectin SML [Collichthys lucidus]